MEQAYPKTPMLGNAELNNKPTNKFRLPGNIKFGVKYALATDDELYYAIKNSERLEEAMQLRATPKAFKEDQLISLCRPQEKNKLDTELHSLKHVLHKVIDHFHHMHNKLLLCETPRKYLEKLKYALKNVKSNEKYDKICKYALNALTIELV